VGDEFYIGYESAMPERMAARIAVTTAALLTIAFSLAVIVATAQRRSAAGTFEYGVERSFEGRIVEYPYPALAVDGRDGIEWYWLVGPGKHGAALLATGLDRRRVRLSGSLIERDGDRMIEVVPASVTTIGSGLSPDLPTETIGGRLVEGEIADSKCHLGVMKPGEGPTHRDCAVRCLLGDIPPMLIERRGGDSRRMALVSADGRSLAGVLGPLAGRPVRVRGILLRRGGQRFLSVSPPDIAPDN